MAPSTPLIALIFAGPFAASCVQFGQFLDFPSDEPALAQLEASLRSVLRRGRIGAVLTEPIQVRGGVPNSTAPVFLPLLRPPVR